MVAQQPAAENAKYLTTAIDPPVLRDRHGARFECKVIGYPELAGQTLDKFAAVCLLDPPGLAPDVWTRLAEYAVAGHGVGVFLGRHAEPIEAFNSRAAQRLLPGVVREQVSRKEGDAFLAPQNYQHPILKPFAPYAARTPWNKFPIYRYWRITDVAANASTVIAYSDGGTALLERTIGKGAAVGRVLLMSTSISDPVSRDAWNYLPVSIGDAKAWPYVILANQMLSYLVFENK